MNRKLIVIVGSTASGKSALAVGVAARCEGEVISADSRQVYQGFDIGSGKVPRDSTKYKVHRTEYYHEGIRHHMLDVASPSRTFTAVQYQKQALRAIKNTWRRGKIPILCGGTGFYIRAVVDGLVLPAVKPNKTLRDKLDKQTNEQLYKELRKRDPERAKTIDQHNKRRLIRALEIVESRGEVPRLAGRPIDADVCIIGIQKDRAELAKLIRTRLMKRLKQGMIAEVKNLRGRGLSWRRLENFGLEYRHVARFLQGKISKEEMSEAIIRDSLALAKRQIQWWKHDPRVVWVASSAEALRLTKKFLQH